DAVGILLRFFQNELRFLLRVALQLICRFLGDNNRLAQSFLYVGKMVQLLLERGDVLLKLLIFTNDRLIVLYDLIEKFVDLILVISANTSGKFLIMYVQRR